METIGPVRPLRTLVAGPDRRVGIGHGWFYRYGVPLGLLALLGLGATNYQYLAGNRHLNPLMNVLLSAGAVVPVAVAARRPLLAFRIAYPFLFLGTIMARASDAWPWSPVQIVGFLGILVAVAVLEPSAVTFWATAVSVAVPFLYTDTANAFGVAVLFVVIALLGDIMSRRRTARRALAEQTELTELERARRSILEERTRIAREMHDVVAHHMSMIAVQAETAPYRLPGMDEPIRDEMAGIATAARTALTDMRRLLGVLRSDDAGAPTAPQPGLADIPELAGTARRAGVEVTLTTGTDDAVREPVGLAAYRIVQEAVSNAIRHAPGSSVTIRFDRQGPTLRLEVVNSPAERTEPFDRSRTPDPAPGHGLIGMRERATSVGGAVSVGPTADGGFAVSASLPLTAILTGQR
jgi:signal transduction histidine kinase